jgi:hypothetical protein
MFNYTFHTEQSEARFLVEISGWLQHDYTHRISPNVFDMCEAKRGT